MGTRQLPATTSELFCDVCGSTAMLYGSGGKCQICDKDVCSSCSHAEEWGGDYPPRWCNRCWEIGAPYRERIEELVQEHEQKTAAQRYAWRCAVADAANAADRESDVTN
jgi:hypothetical protein